jgi:hypothetical protein
VEQIREVMPMELMGHKSLETTLKYLKSLGVDDNRTAGLNEVYTVGDTAV